MNPASEVAGQVSALAAEPGQALEAGAPIVLLSDAIERARVEQASARILAQQKRIEASDAALRGAMARADNAARSYARADTLFAKDSGTRAELYDARAEHLASSAEVNRLKAEAMGERAELQRIEGEFRLAEAELDRRAIRAPGAGRLLSVDVAIGSFVAVGEPIGTFANESPLCARCEVDEVFAMSVREGQPAFVRPLGGTDSLAVGTVSYAGPFLRRKSLFADEVGDLEDRRVREVTIALVSGSSLLLGTRVECVIAVQ